MPLQWNKPKPTETAASTVSYRTMQWVYKLTVDDWSKDFVVELHFAQFHDSDGATDPALVEWVTIKDPNGRADWQWKPESNHDLAETIKAAAHGFHIDVHASAFFVLTVENTLTEWMKENRVAIP